MSFEGVRPADGSSTSVHLAHTPDQVRCLVDQSQSAWSEWRRTPREARAGALREVARRLRRRAVPLSIEMAESMGKPVSQGLGEVEKCAWLCEWVAETGPGILRDRPTTVEGAKATVIYRSLGGVLGVMPWNFPLWQVVRYAAPALLAGNTVLLKHAPNVFGCADALEELFDVGPPGTFTSLRIGVHQLAKVLDHPHVCAGTLTGSTAAGRSFAAACGQRLIPTVLELGGSDAFVILEDADLDSAAEACAASRLLNAGQSCIAAKRIVVVEAVYDAFVEAFVAAMGRRQLGDPLEPRTDVGPMAREDLRDALHAQVVGTVAAGGRLLLGGEVPSRAGWWYPPTVVGDVPLDASMAVQEVFGPAAAVFRVADESAALAVANRSPFGLGAAIFTADLERGERLARDELEAGSCFVNDFVKSHPHLPFGGIKRSGYGRELGVEGIRAFTNVKTVWVR